jgi:hypothetical protein
MLNRFWQRHAATRKWYSLFAPEMVFPGTPKRNPATALNYLKA